MSRDNLPDDFFGERSRLPKEGSNAMLKVGSITAAGAVIGSIGGPIGSAIGAGVGGIIGGVAVIASEINKNNKK